MNKGVVGIIVGLFLFMLVYVFYLQDRNQAIMQELIKTLITPERSGLAGARYLSGFPSYSEETHGKFKSLLSRKAAADDPELISFVRSVMHPPRSTSMIKMSRPLMKTPQAVEIDKIFKKKVNGFFVEAGALDGERSSNTLFFESRRGWHGLLVEPDPYFYTQLVGKNRASWSINACLSIYSYVSEISFRESDGGHGKLSLDSSKLNRVPCFPFQTLLMAINVTEVDFFSLDIEGFELHVLKTIPLDKINIRTLAVEYSHGRKDDYLKFMESNGFETAKHIHYARPELALYVDDYIFVNNKTDV